MIEKGGQLTRREAYQSGAALWPGEPAALQPLAQKTQPDAIMPKQFDQSGTPAAERKHGTTKRVLSKTALHQHRQPVHALAHVGPPAGKIHTDPGARRDHAFFNAASTLPNAA